MLESSEILVNLLPLTEATRGILNGNTFYTLPKGARVINLARGGHLIEDDLLEALEREQISHAVLDVFSLEPLPLAHAFWQHPRISITPHVAAATDPRSAAKIAAQNVHALRAGKPLEHLVEPNRGY